MHNAIALSNAYTLCEAVSQPLLRQLTGSVHAAHRRRRGRRRPEAVTRALRCRVRCRHEPSPRAHRPALAPRATPVGSSRSTLALRDVARLMRIGDTE